MTGHFVTRQFLTPTFCQKLRNIVSGRLMRHFVTRQFITTKKFTNDNLSPSRQFVTRQFVTMTICHERRLTTTATFSHTTICHDHFNVDVSWLRQFVTIIYWRHPLISFRIVWLLSYKRFIYLKKRAGWTRLFSRRFLLEEKTLRNFHYCTVFKKVLYQEHN